MKQTKTIPFDWELYNNNRENYKVVTRDGDDVTQLTKFEETNNDPLAGVLLGNIDAFGIDGKYLKNSENGRDLQLQYEEEVVESWVNLFVTSDGKITVNGATFSSKEKADDAGKQWGNYIKSINLNDLV